MSLNAILTTAASALLANSRRVNATAGNIANIDTEGFRPRDVRTVSRTLGSLRSGASTGGGVQTTVVEEDGPVEPVREFTKLIQARTAYNAALQTLRVADQISRKTINFSA